MMMRRRRVEFWGRRWPIRLGNRWRLATIGASCRTELSGALCVGLYRDILQGGWCHVEGGKTKRGRTAEGMMNSRSEVTEVKRKMPVGVLW